QINNDNYKIPESDPDQLGHRRSDYIEPFLNYIISEAGYSNDVVFAAPRLYGRLFAKEGRAYVPLHRPVRHFLCCDLYADIDVVDCHPVLICQLLQLFGDETGFQLMNKWSKNREAY